MPSRSVHITQEADRVTLQRWDGAKVALHDVIALVVRHGGRLKILAVGETPEELERADLSPEERAALQKAEFVPVLSAQDFSLDRAEAFFRYLVFAAMQGAPMATQVLRPALHVDSPALEALTPETRKELTRLLKRLGSPAFLNGRRL